MAFDFTPFFQKLEVLLSEADTLFAAIQAKHPECVTCKQGCSDCCHALFDLSLIESLYINHHFHRQLPQDMKDPILGKADQADRLAYKLKYQAYKDHRDGTPTETILENMARKRIRCPLLNSRDECDMYDHRPLTCRLYGVPQAIEGQSRTCSLSKFEPGTPYPAVHVDKLQRKLAGLSMELVAAMNTKHSKMGDMLIPLSMALLTVYDDEYLGIEQLGCARHGCSPAGCNAGDCSDGGCGCQS